MKCDSCKNKDICKHIETMVEAEEKQLKYKDAPISVEAKCWRYTSKEPQNGIGKLVQDNRTSFEGAIRSWNNGIIY